MTDITASMVKELRELTGAGMMECKKALTEAKGDIQLAIDNMRKSGQAKAAKRAGRIAAEGVIIISTSRDSKVASMCEVNCETDFVARDNSFRSFAELVSNTSLSLQTNDVTEVMSQSVTHDNGATCEIVRETLVSKIGENIQLRRVVTLTSTGCVGYYLHGDRIGVLVALDKNDAVLAKDIAMHIAATRPIAIDTNQLSESVVAKEREIITAQAQTSGKPANIIEKMVEGRLQKFAQEVCLVYQPFVKNPEQTVQSLLQAAKAKVLAFERFEVGEGIDKPTTNFADEVSAVIKGDA
ncbi:MAG: translation elongation factor Ts [Gammaproteobacteria bacterium RIFCSPLOWO2_02_FULL_42_14]|nr:MAG: translation elongation factor Ts [Gammaproteobacteria bacterium RIFCSPHIGHO2_02_FULL_42_43]OGT27427.1 MAG: translation elongation factor Ts [Gammaproteobacteria bacterium RIFCSPHIGHO2_01_FULL_42_8]OGT52364.1 MAG: translation elongation factor Ts [Gammaproteobacteria bacterium RIFCSPHIGHO2_12_FULL_41_25]OGT63346.1 MAG: translation elongation factor Ts [Gammaproteobacteria bacterium RIFCSPLOWO2_02_FULL_42_14]OGT86313.1 MAG: translation elongation factor Ts [Gammaproteobacteria bacterium R